MNDEGERVPLVFQQFKKQKKELYIRLALIIITISLSLFYFDLGAPLPPYTPWFKTDDCYAISFHSFENNNGTLNFTFLADETYELPREYLPNLIKIFGNSTLFNVTYFGSLGSRRSVENNIVTIIVPHQVQANFDFSITCLNDIYIKKISENINFIEKRNDDMSVIKDLLQNGELFNDVCLSLNKKGFELSFFSYLNGVHKPFNFYPYNLIFRIRENTFNEYTKIFHIGVSKENTIFVPDLNYVPWKQLLFDVPAIINIKEYSNYKDFKIMLPQNKQINNHPFVSKITDFQNDQCFNSLAISSALTNISINDDIALNNVLSTNFDSFRKAYVFNFVEKKNVAISKHLPELQEIIQEACPNCEITIFDENFQRLNSLLNHANIIVGNHISNLAQMIFMNNGTHVVDFSPKKYSCNKWINKFALKFDINYHSIWNFTDFNKCDCPHFNVCYPEHPERIENENINLDYIRKLFLNILK